MRRGAKPGRAKVKARPPVARKPLKSEGSRVRDFETRLAEVLDQQAATSEILRVISSSRTDVQPVFNAIVESAVRLCDARHGAVFSYDGDFLHLAAHYNFSETWLEDVGKQYPMRPTRTHISGRAILRGAVVQLPDFRLDPEYGSPLMAVYGFRSLLAVPILRGDTPVGVIVIYRPEPGPFSDEHISLLQTFAEQAVIAIENVRLFTELQEKNSSLTAAHAQVTESLEQQTATAEILRVISQSQTDVQPVFDTLIRSAVRLCDGLFGAVVMFDGEMLQRAEATYNYTPAAMAAMQRMYPMRPDRSQLNGRAILSRTVAHIPDVLNDSEYAPDIAVAGGWRSGVSAPMLRQGRPVGTILITRAQAGPFSERQIALLQTFADQAVIAIENVRLFSELEGRNRDLTATAEILRVISSSPTDVQPVFHTIVRSAVRLCDGLFSGLLKFDGELLHYVAHHNFTPEALEEVRRVFPARPSRGYGAGRAIVERAVVHIPDVELDPEFQLPALYRTVGWRSGLFVPMLREGAPIGVIAVTRAEPGPFSDNEIELVTTFADQAVIAIENVRLFTELEVRNRDLTESLEQQTATGEILRVISSSPMDALPTFEAIAAAATALCAAENAGVFLFDGRLIHFAAHHHWSADDLDAIRQVFPRPPGRGSVTARAILTRAVAHVPDLTKDPEYEETSIIQAGFRAVLSVPMLRDGQAIGAINVTRREPVAFSETQIALLETFARQAVIAVENVRLFKELEARTGELTQSVEKLTALGEVSRAVSSTLDVETVLDTIVSRASQLAGADGCAIYEYDDATEAFHIRATHNLDSALVETLRAAPLRKGEGTMGRAAETREPTQVADIAAPGAYQSHIRDTLLGAGYRALLSVPLLREGEIIGSLSLNRHTPGEFPPEAVEVLKTFATQSALAIQNARLFREIADKSAQLEAASRHKSEFLANMSHELRTPLNAIIGFSEVLTERMFGELNEKQDEYLRDIYASGQHLLSLINDILDLSKIEAGRMELEATDFDLPGALDNALTLVRERATRRGIALGHTIDERLGTIRGDERKVKQVLLNLLSNALKFTPEGGRIDVSAGVRDEVAEIAVTDTGVGIAPEDQEAVFEEFRQVATADKKVEGTGLGLALSRKFIELHGGRIWVTSAVGVGSTFTFTLPVRRGE